MKIGMVGLGRLGLPVILAIESKGHEIAGYDINPKIDQIINSRVYPHQEEGCQELLEKSKIKLLSLSELAQFSDIIFVAIQTPHEEKYEGKTRVPNERKDFNYEYLKAGMESLSGEIEKLQQDKIVAIISTVLPGTIRREIMPLLNKYVNLIYNPSFIAMSTVIFDFLNPEFVLCGSEDNNALFILKDFYFSIVSSPLIMPVMQISIESAELTKVLYNTSITAKISLANTAMELCEKIPGANIDDVTDCLKMAINRIVSPTYMDGGLGDSGPCHPRDLIAMSWLAQKLDLSHSIYDDLIKAREDQTEWLANLIIKKQKETDYGIIILGKAYKKGTNLTDGSCSILLKNILNEKGHYDVLMYDPYIDDKTPVSFFVAPAIFFIGTNHDEFKAFPFPKSSIVLDPWRYIPQQNDIEIIGIGRKNI